MKDRLGLLVAGMFLACLAWALWHWLGDDGFGTISTLALIALAIDNIRLRRELKATPNPE